MHFIKKKKISGPVEANFKEKNHGASATVTFAILSPFIRQQTNPQSRKKGKLLRFTLNQGAKKRR